MSEARRIKRQFGKQRSDGSKANVQQPQFITQYLVLQNPDLQKCVNDVFGALNTGWQPLGGMTQSQAPSRNPPPPESADATGPEESPAGTGGPLGLHYMQTLFRTVLRVDWDREVAAARAAEELKNNPPAQEEPPAEPGPDDAPVEEPSEPTAN